MAFKARYVALALAMGTPIPAAAQQASPLEQPGLREYVTQVLARNAALAASSSDLEAAVERIPPAGALPDPILSFGMMSVPVPSFDFAEEAMTQLPIAVRQAFPFPGKQGARTAVARGDSAVAALGVEMTASVLAAQAAAAFFELAYASTALGVWRHRVELADQALRTARTRYQTGQVPQTDLLRAELRRARLAEEGHRFTAEVEAAAARADAFRGGPGDSISVPGLARPDSVLLQAALRDTLRAREQLTQILRALNPLLRQAAAHVDRARASARVFAIAARPDFAIGVQTGMRLGGREPFLTAIVGVSVPLWAGRKQSPAARAAALEVRSSEQR
ncbi:MAG: TolC family protein, partial [Gemmatimonadota bacterium]